MIAPEVQVRGYGGEYPARPARMDPELELAAALTRNLERADVRWHYLERDIRRGFKSGGITAGRPWDDVALSARAISGTLVTKHFDDLGAAMLRLYDRFERLERRHDDRIEQLKARGIMALAAAAAVVTAAAVALTAWQP